ncbi:MAG: AAA family ATPase [Patescibacteria group bacterium]
MFRRLTEAILPFIMKVMVHRKETLSAKAKKAQEAFINKLQSEIGLVKRRTRKPTVIAFFGLVGSGKSSVAQELARQIGGVVIEGDAIRVELRKVGEVYSYGERRQYSYVRQIAENVALEISKRGGNVIFDADFADMKKRASLKAKITKVGAELVFIRTHADPEVMFGRMLSASYRNSPDDFFGGAKTTMKGGTEQQRGAVIKFREMWRRTPHHYQWSSIGGGRWFLKSPPVRLLANVDTTEPAKWKEEVKKLAQKLINL